MKLLKFRKYLEIAKKGLKFAPVVELAKLNFTRSTKTAKAGPGFDHRFEHTAAKINLNWIKSYDIISIRLFFPA